MVRKGDTLDDVIKYVDFRINHLKLEREKVPFTVNVKHRGKAIHKLSSRILELRRLKRVLNEDIKEYSKYEWNKWKHLEKMKVDSLQRQQAKSIADQKPFLKTIQRNHKNHVKWERRHGIMNNHLCSRCDRIIGGGRSVCMTCIGYAVRKVCREKERKKSGSEKSK